MTARFYGNGRVGAGRRDARRRSVPRGWRGCIERAAAILVDTQPRFSGMNFSVFVLFSPTLSLLLPLSYSSTLLAARFPCHSSMYTCSYSLSLCPLLCLLSRRLLLLDPLSASTHTTTHTVSLGLGSYRQGRNNAALSGSWTRGVTSPAFADTVNAFALRLTRGFRDNAAGFKCFRVCQDFRRWRCVVRWGFFFLRIFALRLGSVGDGFMMGVYKGWIVLMISESVHGVF